MARRMWPPGSPSWRGRTNTVSSSDPETTPSWPARATALASLQFETATPMPPWITRGNVDFDVIFNLSPPSHSGLSGIPWRDEPLLPERHDPRPRRDALARRDVLSRGGGGTPAARHRAARDSPTP